MARTGPQLHVDVKKICKYLIIICSNYHKFGSSDLRGICFAVRCSVLFSNQVKKGLLKADSFRSVAGCSYA